MTTFRVIHIVPILVAAALFGCHSEETHGLGAKFADTDPAPIQTLAVKASSAPVLVKGEMIEKCPVAGCWFVLKDKTGVIHVDTKAAGFVVTDVPLHTRLTVSGTLTPGAQPGINAAGIRY